MNEETNYEIVTGDCLEYLKNDKIDEVDLTFLLNKGQNCPLVEPT